MTIRLFVFSISTLLLTPISFGADLSPVEIMTRSLKAFYYPGNDMRARISMVLVNPQGKKRQRELTMLRKNEGQKGNQRYFIYFHFPADVKGMTFMVWKYPKKEDDRWIFIPAIKLSRRIASNDKRSSFVGSDFTYEDISGRSVSDETHKLLRSETLGERPCYVVESHPKESTNYARRLSWIDKKRWLPLQEEYFDRRGEKIRLFNAKNVKEIDGNWTIVKRVMKNLQSGHYTEVIYTETSYNIGLSKKVFTNLSLRNPPRKWIRK